jgi:hypothetical protein
MAAYRLPKVTLQASWSASASTAIAPYVARLCSTITLTNPGSCSLLGDFSTKPIGLSLAPIRGHQLHNLGSRSQQTFPIIKHNPKIYLESWNSGQLETINRPSKQNLPLMADFQATAGCNFHSLTVARRPLS